MKNFLTKLSVLVACLSFVMPASAYSLWLAGNAGAMGSDTQAGWSGTSFIQVTSDANGDVYFWADGDFKLSKANNPSNWDSFNSALIKLDSSGTINWGWGDNSNVGSGKKCVKFHMETNKDYYTVQDIWSYYSLRGSGNDYDAGKRAELTWNSTNKQYEGTVTVDADTWISKITVGSSSSNKDEKWYGPSSEQTVNKTTNFGVQLDGKEIKFEKGTYNLYLKSEGDLQGTNPTHLYITGGGGGSTTNDIYIYGDFSGANTGSDYPSNNWGDITWKKMTLKSGSETIYQYKFSANKDGKVYFRINDNNKEYGPSDSGANYVLLTDDRFVDAGENKSTAFEFKAKNGHTYYIKYTTDYHSVAVYDSYVPTPAVPTARPTSLYFYSNNFGGLGEKVPLMVRSADGKTFTYRFNYTANTPIKFNFREYPADWRGVRVYPAVHATAATLATNLAAQYDVFNADPDKMWSFTSTSGDPVTVTVTFPNVNTAFVKVTQAPAPVYEASYYIHAGFLNNWDRTQRVKFMQLGSDPKVLTASVRYHEYNDGNKGFKITDKPIDDNGTWYSTGSELTNGTEVTLGSEKGNMSLYESALGKAVTYTLTLDDNNKPVSIKAEWVGNDPIVIGNQMPVYPIGVYTNTAFKRYDEWPVLYLKGRVLNDMRVTPEYQLTQITPTKYELEFTARNSKTNNGEDGQYKDEYYSVIAYFDANSDAVEIGQKSLDLMKIKTYNGREHDGTRFKAICEKGADGNWTFTLSPVGDVDDIPFISMIGQDWYQRDNYKTPYGNKYTNEDPSNSNTKWGWQESWIQYDNNGQVLKDRKGNVMYNTMWPPRNPILFKTIFSVGGQSKNFTLNSKDLTFVKVETHKGKDWKTHEFFKNYNKEAHDRTKPSVHANALALEEDAEYTLYRVENMWINGHVKIWSGWGGVTYKNRNETTDLANWDFHTNWGHYEKGSLGSTFTIPAGSTVPLSNEYGDMQFNQPTYFKYVDLFIDNSKKSNEHGYSVLFTELAKGGAQIAALSGRDKRTDVTEYEVGNYQPALNCLEGVKNGIVKSVTINCYSCATGEMEEHVFDWKWDGKAASKVTNTNFKKIFESEPSMVFLNDNDENANTGSNSDDNGGSSIGKWVKDTNKYVSGDYFYRMLVTLSEDADGLQTHDISVDSNPFTIVKPEAIDIDVYQLVKIKDNVNEDGTVEGGVVKGEYYTYKADPKDVTKSLLPIYKLTIINDDKFDGEHYNFEYDTNGNMIGGYIDDSNYEFTSRTLTEEEIENVDFTSSDLQVTDKILIVGTRPTVNSVNGYSFSAENVNGEIIPPTITDNTDSNTENNTAGNVIAKSAPEKEGGQTEEFDQSYMRPDQNNRFMHVTNAGTFNQREIKVKMEYLVPVINGEVVEDVPQYTEEAVAIYQPVIPEPTLVDAKVEVFYGTNGTADTDDDTDVFTYAGQDFEARFHNVRDYVEVEYPNVSRYMMERMRIRDFFTIKMISDDDENPDQVWSNIFQFGDHPDPAKQTSAIATGAFMLPKDFSKTRTIILDKREKGADNAPLKYLPRWGEDKQITPIEVSGYAPNNLEVQIVQYSETGDNELAPRIDRDENGDLISQYTIRLKHLEGFNPNDPDAEADHTDHDDAYYNKPDDDTGLYPERHNYIYHEGKDDLKEPLHHHSDKDYYYVAIIDREGNVDPDNDEFGDIIDVNGLKPGETINSEDKLVSYDSSKLMHFLIPATDLLGDNYREITIKKNYGQENEWSTDFSKDPDTDPAINAYNYDMRVIALGKENHFSKNIHVLVSYLYPFKVEASGSIVNTPTEGTENTDGPNRAKMNYSENVLKSEAAVLDKGLGEDSYVITGVNALNAEQYGNVKIGEGFIEVEGFGVQVVNSAGMLIGEGEGRYDVTPGVYMVRYNGKTTKVVVR